MKKIIACLLFVFALLFPVETMAYAAEEGYTYSEYVDEVAGIVEPYLSFDYKPKLHYKHNFLFIQWGGEAVEWDIETVSFNFTMNNEHSGDYNVGYLPSDMDITFDYVYISMNEEGLVSSSGASFTYSLADIDCDSGYVEFSFPYEEILAGCKYYGVDGYHTIINSVEVTISSRILKTHGTSMYYVFDVDRNFAKQIYTGIKFYTRTDKDRLLVSDKSDSSKSLDGLYHFVVVYTGSAEEISFAISDFFKMILIDLPGVVLNVIKFFFEFIIMLPGFIHMVVPFLPEYLIAAIMFVIALGIVWGIVAWIRHLKG